jgi:DNA-binding GntR family transcriptional regulator
MGVSPTPVKDALRKLLAEGLIHIQPRKGTFVTQISSQGIRDSFELREALETKACELLTGKIDASRIARLRTVNEALGKSTLTLEQEVRLDSGFHRLLVGYTGNRRLLEVHSQLNAHLQIARIYYRSEDWKHGLPLAIKAHADIVSALEKKQIEEAKEVLKNHIRRSMRLLINAHRRITKSSQAETKVRVRSTMQIEGRAPQRFEET